MDIAYSFTNSDTYIYIKASLFVCLSMCFSQTESRIATKFSQRIRCTMGKKLMEPVLIACPLVLPLGFHILIDAFDAQTDVQLNGLDKLGGS